MRRYIRHISILPILLALLITTSSSIANNQNFQPTPPPPNVEEIKQAIQTEIQNQAEKVIGYLIYQTQIEKINVSEDGDFAIVWLGYIDPQTSTPINTEPGLVILTRVDNIWRAYLPSTRGWSDLVKTAPPDLLSNLDKQIWLQMYAERTENINVGPFHGYLLPWEAGKSLYLTRSILHYNPPNPSGSMHYAFDFAAPHDSSGTSPMFEIYAAKGGTVKYARWSQENGSESPPGNYIVLEDTSTQPTTYQLYLHLAKDSIPEELRNIGAKVVQGQYLGLADDTGYSTANHLHFQVHTNPSSYWGNSVDITFDDVMINGGRPRTPNEATYYPQYGDEGQWTYISGNQVSTDRTPPIGDFLNPQHGDILTSAEVNIQGWATDDDSGLSSVFIMAYFNDSWQVISPDLSSTMQNGIFNYQWDICSDSVPEEPVSLSLLLTDNKGNVSTGYAGLTHVINQYNCEPTVPQPACTVEPDEVALFTNTNYQGTCQIYTIGNYPHAEDLGVLNGEIIRSLRTGAGVNLTLFSEENYTGRSESFYTSDRNLSDNLIANQKISSMKISPINISPYPPEPIYPNNTTITDTQVVYFTWMDRGGGIQYQVNITTPNQIITSPWITSTNYTTVLTQTGVYTWSVRALNAGLNPSAWSAPASFAITNSQLSTVTVSTPYTETFETGIPDWDSTGLWHILTDTQKAHQGENFFVYARVNHDDYTTQIPNEGYLISPQISLALSSKEYILQFWSWYETESEYTHFDQRWVQISINKGPYINLLKLKNDPQRGWTKYTVDLKPFLDNLSGQTADIRIRFVFRSIDTTDNQYNGWRIDDVSIFPNTPMSCNDEPFNDTASKAESLSFGETTNHQICPSRDQDYFSFNGTAGDKIVIDIDAQTISSTLDAIVFLLDEDGQSIIAEHDDEVLGIQLDPYLVYTLPYTGKYFIRLEAWDFPQGTGSYSIKLIRDQQPPSLDIQSPQSHSFIGKSGWFIEATASDTETNVEKIEFYWHGGDWSIDTWEYIGTDDDPSGGWRLPFTLTNVTDQDQTVLFAKAFDGAGNWAGDLAWDLYLDASPPDTIGQPLLNPSETTYIHLTWTTTDTLSGVNLIDVRMKTDQDTIWQQLASGLSADTTSLVYIGVPGISYQFQVRAIDKAGNPEAYNNGAVYQTSVPYITELCKDFDLPDTGGHNNNPANATPQSILTTSNFFNFCNPLQTDRYNDEDWFSITLNQNQRAVIYVQPLHESVSIHLELYDADGTTLLAHATSPAYGDSVLLQAQNLPLGSYYLRITHTDGQVIGDNTRYMLSVQTLATYLPLIIR